MEKTVQLIAVRKDLALSKGTVAAVAASASMKMLMRYMSINVENMYVPNSAVWTLITTKSSPIHRWLLDNQRKKIVGAADLKDLENLKAKANEFSIQYLNFEMTIAPDQVETVSIVIGPDYEDIINNFASNYKELL